jgi:diguanylate cyclase (GGDEF)-like protein
VDILVEFLRLLFLTLLVLSGLVGLLAITSPKAFTTVVAYGNRNVLFGTGPSVFENWFDIDQYVLANARLFGLVIIASEGFIWVISRYGPDAYSKSFLLITICVAILVGVLALGHILRQKRAIETNLAEAHTDTLTELPNRRAFDAELSRRLAQRQRQGTPVCLQIIDIDEFKTFNDRFGHLLGDAILKEVGKILATTARQMDIVARLGGDEFAVLLPGTNLQEASYAAERFRNAVCRSPISFEGREHTLTISSGVAEAQVDDDSRSLLKRADSALYAAKEAGRNCSFRHGGPELATPDPADEPICVST